MIQVKYKCNKEIVSTNFPKELKDLKDTFKENRITLAGNEDHKWLDNYKDKSINIYDLNYLCKIIINNLDYRQIKKLNAIVSISQFKSINEMINTINYLNSFGLIDNLEDINNPVNLVRKLFNQIYDLKVPDDLNIPKSDSEWEVVGKRVKKNLSHHRTAYGWLFMLEKVPQLKENEIPVFKHCNQNAQINVYIINTTNKKKLIVPLPQYNDQLNEHLLRADIFNELAVIFDFKIETMNYETFNLIKNTLRESKINEVNTLTQKLDSLLNEESLVFSLLLKQLQGSSITKLNHLLDNIKEVVLLRDIELESKDYAKARLDMLISDDFNTYQKMIDKFLDYKAVGEYLLDKENVKSSEAGILILPDNLSYLIDKKKRR